MAKRGKDAVAITRLEEALGLVFDAYSTSKGVEQICLTLVSKLPKSDLDSDISSMELSDLFRLKEDLQIQSNRIGNKILEIDSAIKSLVNGKPNQAKDEVTPKKKKEKKNKDEKNKEVENKNSIVGEAKDIVDKNENKIEEDNTKVEESNEAK